jgi:hypothetical protein
MISNTRRRRKAMKQLAMYFAEKGKVLSLREFKAANDGPIRISAIKNTFGTYHRMITLIHATEKEVLSLLDSDTATEFDSLLVEEPVVPVVDKTLQALLEAREEKAHEE